MEVIRPGDPKRIRAVLWAGECEVCGCRIRCSKDDPAFSYSDYHCSQGEVDCPTCKETIALREGKVWPDEDADKDD